MIKGVLFDKDGTLIAFDDMWGAIYLDILTGHYGYSEAQALAMLVRSGYDPETGGCRAGSPMAAAPLSHVTAAWWPELSPAEHKARARHLAELSKGHKHEKVEAVVHLPPLFQKLQAMGLVLGVATNDGEASANSHMDILDVRGHFHSVIGADGVASPKPSGDMIKRFAREAGIKPSEVAMVGDNHHDMSEARAGGAGLAIGVLSGTSSHDDLSPIADHVITDIGQLPDLLRKYC